MNNIPPSVLQAIVDERARQIIGEKFGHEHDDMHTEGEIADAAACYAMTADSRSQSGRVFGLTFRTVLWPWDEKWWKPSPEDRRRELVKAAAMLIAEIERLDRAEASNLARR